MTYVLLIYQPPGFDPKALPEAEQKAMGAAYAALRALPTVELGLPLGELDDAVTVQVVEGVPRNSSGPYAGVSGAVGGYFILNVETRAEALAIAAEVPAARWGGAVEVRPAQAYW